MNWVRGLSPIPMTLTTLPDGRMRKVFRAQTLPSDEAVALPAPGTWPSDGRRYLRVAADGWLELLDV